MFLSDEGPTLKTLDFTFYIGSTPTFLYFDLYLNTAYAAHYVLCFSLTKGVRSKRYTSLSISAVHQSLYLIRFVFQHCLRSTLRLFHLFYEYCEF